MNCSLCEEERFETLPSVFVASLPGLVLASLEATYEYGSLQSLTVLNSDEALSRHYIPTE